MKLNKITQKKLMSKQQAMKIVYVQIICAAIFSMLMAIFYSKEHMLSAWYGSFTVIFPTFILVLYLFSTQSDSPHEQMKAFYKAEGWKWLLTILLFIICIKFLTLQPLVYFSSFIIGLMSYWVFLAIDLGKCRFSKKNI